MDALEDRAGNSLSLRSSGPLLLSSSAHNRHTVRNKKSLHGPKDDIQDNTCCPQNYIMLIQRTKPVRRNTVQCGEIYI